MKSDDCRISFAGNDYIHDRQQFVRFDGLGDDGKGAHTHYEQIYISSIEPRARLLHRLYQTLR